MYLLHYTADLGRPSWESLIKKHVSIGRPKVHDFLSAIFQIVQQQLA